MVDVRNEAQGSIAQPVIDGRLRIENAVFSSSSLPVGIESGEWRREHFRKIGSDIAKLRQCGGGTINVNRHRQLWQRFPISISPMQANSVPFVRAACAQF